MTATKKRQHYVRISNYLTGLGYFLLSFIMLLTVAFGLIWLLNERSSEVVLTPQVVVSPDDEVHGGEAAAVSSLLAIVLVYGVTATIMVLSAFVIVLIPYIVGSYWDKALRAILRFGGLMGTARTLYISKVLTSLFLYSFYVCCAFGAHLSISYELVVFGGIVTAIAGVLFTVQYVYATLVQLRDSDVW